MKNKTEKMFLDGIEKIIVKNKKINVMTICEEAGISRQSFYKYFIDIDDFMFWVHQKLFVESFVSIFKNEGFKIITYNFESEMEIYGINSNGDLERALEKL